MTSKAISKNQAEAYLTKVAEFFHIGQILTARYLEEALANHNWKISTDKGQEYIIKILVGQTKKGIENHLEIRKQLQGTGINTTNWMQNLSGSVFYEDGVVISVVSPVIAGKYPDEIDTKLLHEIGKAIGLFHTNVTYLPHQQTSWLNIMSFNNRLTKNKQIERAKRFVDLSRDIFTMDLPIGIIHGDVFRTNFFVDEHDPYKIVALFDFETAERNILILDLARTILENCKSADRLSIDQNKVDPLLMGYSSIRQLTNTELSALRKAVLYVAGMTTFWFVKNGYEEIASGYLDRAEKYREY